MESLDLPGTLSSLEAAGDFVLKVANEAGFDKKQAYRLHLAVDELATNVVTHAYDEKNREGNLYLRAWTQDGQLIVSLEDDGEPFDPTTLAQPKNQGKPLEEQEEGGWGVFLAKKSVDDLRYSFHNGRNRVEFVMKLPSGNPQA